MGCETIHDEMNLIFAFILIRTIADTMQQDSSAQAISSVVIIFLVLGPHLPWAERDDTLGHACSQQSILDYTTI
jgi:hypothetical protein